MTASPTNSQSHGAHSSSGGSGGQNPASYTPDELAFHKLFPQVPLNEKLVESYQCGLSRKKIVRMGRLYLTSLRLCFHSTFLSESLMMEWEQVDAVEKKENFVFEAIVVKGSAGETHYFSAFMYGITDQAHKMTTMLWNVRRKYAVGGGHVAGGGSMRTFHGRTESTASTGSAGGALHTSESPDLGPLAADRASPQHLTGVAYPPPSPTSQITSPIHEAAPLTSPPIGPASTGAEASLPEEKSLDNCSMTSPRHADAVQTAENGRNAMKSPTREANGSGLSDTQVGGRVDDLEGNPLGVKQDTLLPTGRASGTSSPAPPPVTVAAEPRSPALKAQAPQPLASAPPPAAPATPIHPHPTKTERRTEKAIARSSVVVDTPHDVLKYFPLVPKAETVVDSFQCSYIIGVHRLGKLYITANYVLFSSVMLSEGVCLKFSDIVSIEKEQTMVILDGVVIVTRQGQTHAFTSFVNRDSAFSILQHFFGAHKTKQSTKDKLRGNVDRVDSSTSFAASVVSIATEEAASPVAGVESATNSASSPANDFLPVVKAPVASAFRTSLAQASYDALPVADSIDTFSKVATDFGTGLSEVGKFLAKQIIPDVPFPTGVTIFDVFKAMFDDDTALLDAYHVQRQDAGMVWEPWRAPAAGSPPFSGQRKMTCTTIIRAVMAKQCDFTEFQRFAFAMIHGEPHLLVQLSGQAVGVMFSDSFRAETLLVFSQPSAMEPVVSMRTYGYIQFLRSVWVKNKILSTALDVEMPECYRKLSAMGIAKVKEIPRVAISKASDAQGEAAVAVKQDTVAAPRPPAVAPMVSAVPSSPLSVVPPAAFASVAVPAAPSSPMVKQLLAGLCGIAILYLIKALWATFWFDCESALLATNAPSMDVAVGAIVMLDLRWLAYIARPTLMAAQLLLLAAIAGRVERLLN
jgi:hypothetical protein